MKKTRNAPLKNDLKKVQKIIRAVAQITGVESEVLLSRTRRQPAAFARQLCMAIGYRTTYMSMAQIAECFSRDHGTVVYAIKKVDEACEDKTVAILLKYILHSIK